MTSGASLAVLLSRSAARFPEHVAVVDPARAAITYRDLDARAEQLCAQLCEAGVGPGDRVGIYAPKSPGSVIAIFAVLKAGAAYVPVDPLAPPARNAYIFTDCAVKAMLIDAPLVDALRAALPEVTLTVAAGLDQDDALGCYLQVLLPGWRAQHTTDPAAQDLAYILYTSGSTGRPKGVMHRHASALAFIDWCAAEFAPDEHDRFSSHAPFHFDLSILDLYVPIAHGARVVLIGEELGKQPLRLAPLIAEHRLTVWYSTPSILRLLVEFGRLDAVDCQSLRLVLFAGEVFPVKHLRALQARWPHPAYYNLYGPTETNVCTFHRVSGVVPESRTEPLPIGIACSGDRTRVVDKQDRVLARGAEGELLVSGGSVMAGYWNLPEQNARAFVRDEEGVLWYRTGDVVREEADGHYTYLGRRDRMVKRRGFRVELGEIEAVLYRHGEIAEVAVIAAPDEESGVQLRAFLCWSGQARPSQIALRRFASENLPAYMVPDRFIVLPALPKTSTDKTDYQQLEALG
jgi:amino acid adenylation domain-containing protein